MREFGSNLGAVTSSNALILWTSPGSLQGNQGLSVHTVLGNPDEPTTEDARDSSQAEKSGLPASQ